MSDNRPTMLIIMDGWGLADAGPGNAVHLARTPNFDRLLQTRPWTSLICYGTRVGLPAGQMGNSEVGHLNLGAGRVVFQDITRIDQAIETGQFNHNPVFNRLMDDLAATGGTLHLLGLVSDGGVHSSLNHLYALLELAGLKRLENVCLHAFMDGRDTSPHGGRDYMAEVISVMEELGVGRVATLGGRYWGMDRDKRWQRVERHFRTLVLGEGRRTESPLAALEDSYSEDETDEFIQPTVVVDGGEPVGLIRDGDGVIFFNFRADRARELTRALTLPGFDEFDVSARPGLAGYVTMTLYDAQFTTPIAFPPERLEGILGEVVSRAGLDQLRIAETEKYAHVTYFFNGGVEEPFAGEDRILIPSPKEVDTYDQKPPMSAPAVTDKVLERIETDCPALIILNFANGDMVGHTGVLEAAIEACQTVDECVGRIESVVVERGGRLLVTSDHGNAEVMIGPDGYPYTAHSVDKPVPLVLIDGPGRGLADGGALCDVAPTILELMGLDQPPEMTGRSLLTREKGD